ncbi:hypothetical protein HK102_009081, partial [Quaeritorhiza haematococci]
LIVIAQGIAARVKRKQASSADAVRYAALFLPLADALLEIVDRGDLDDGGSGGDKSDKARL